MRDLHGYDSPPDGDPARVEVMQLLFTPDLDAWSAFFARLGFAGGADPDWRELRGVPGSGAIGLHLADAAPAPADASALAFAIAGPLDAVARRMRGAGYRVDDILDAGALHLEVIDPDGERIEIHSPGGLALAGA